MTSALKTTALLAPLLVGAVLAGEKSPEMTAQQAMAFAKKMDAQQRASLMQQARDIDTQIAQLQVQVKSLQTQLAKSPRYFDEPLSDPLRP